MTRNGNYSTFNGGRFTYSDYSSVTCSKCGNVWRTRLAYVQRLPDWVRPEKASKLPPSGLDKLGKHLEEIGATQL